MKDNRGQALVEFVLVLPVIILVLFGMIEISNLIYQKYQLETHIDPIIELYKDDEELVNNYQNKNKFNATFDKNGDLVKVTLTKRVSLITPGITSFLGNPFEVKTERTFYVGDGNE